MKTPENYSPEPGSAEWSMREAEQGAENERVWKEAQGIEDNSDNEENESIVLPEKSMEKVNALVNKVEGYMDVVYTEDLPEELLGALEREFGFDKEEGEEFYGKEPIVMLPYLDEPNRTYLFVENGRMGEERVIVTKSGLCVHSDEADLPEGEVGLATFTSPEYRRGEINKDKMEVRNLGKEAFNELYSSNQFTEKLEDPMNTFKTWLDSQKQEIIALDYPSVDIYKDVENHPERIPGALESQGGDEDLLIVINLEKLKEPYIASELIDSISRWNFDHMGVQLLWQSEQPLASFENSLEETMMLADYEEEKPFAVVIATAHG